ncbi:hypothetical protein MMC22_003897 [Lobaria immixta]|nr:hypothetical protein [Lobaria immixta]
MCQYTILKHACGHKKDPRWIQCKEALDKCSSQGPRNSRDKGTKYCHGGLIQGEDPTDIMWSHESSKPGPQPPVTEHVQDHKDLCGQCSWEKYQQKHEEKRTKREESGNKPSVIQRGLAMLRSPREKSGEWDAK